MKPYVFSKKKYELSQKQWKQTGCNISYFESSFHYENIDLSNLYNLKINHLAR